MRYCDGIGHIYCITCLVNGKMYIGQTVKSIEKRFKEHRQKISEAKKGVKRKPFSEEWKKKLSESHFGKKNHFFGKKHSEEARRKMSETKSRRKIHEILVQ